MPSGRVMNLLSDRVLWESRQREVKEIRSENGIVLRVFGFNVCFMHVGAHV